MSNLKKINRRKEITKKQSKYVDIFLFEFQISEMFTGTRNKETHILNLNIRSVLNIFANNQLLTIFS